MRAILPERVRIVDALRGIASLAVCLFHLTNGKVDFLPSGWLKSAGSYGWLGVEVFFVISGFILPYALCRASYQVRQFGTFLLKRVTRLDPPYIATIGLILFFNYLSAKTPGFKGGPFEVSTLQIVLHAAYLNAFFGYEWLSPIFWTLAIEFQFYWLIGLLFPLVVHPRLWVRAGLLGVSAAMAVLVPAGGFVFHWLPLFMIGMLAFQTQASLIGKQSFFVGLGCLITFGSYTHGVLIAVVGAATATAIVLANFNSRTLFFLGKISYSLYLIHVVVGVKIVNLGSRYVSGMPGKLLVLTFALAASIAGAYALYRLIEAPAQRWASAIKFRSPKLKALVPATQDV
ncbi:MAG TPA: acyltransferase [Blastocatellia bacterium]|nr:acyltransferase [Blastocatellia bacterium]HMV85713.1 acyltransferase [Blastocatellia bacterium]HMX29847.1 acyltransferase [Blastocatellia bacterium]HMY73171.1 acyltransferase [Blastocatellia bacterium]HMZ16412.1 acyltransferase [Blastocatellia bacterium]